MHAQMHRQRLRARLLNYKALIISKRRQLHQATHTSKRQRLQQQLDSLWQTFDSIAIELQTEISE